MLEKVLTLHKFMLFPCLSAPPGHAVDAHLMAGRGCRGPLSMEMSSAWAQKCANSHTDVRNRTLCRWG